MSRQQQVLVIQRRMPHYRVAFFEALREELPNLGIELVLAYGDPTVDEASKRDSAHIEWATRLRTTYWLSGKICWQPFSHLMRSADAVVLTPENKLVNNLHAQLVQGRSRVLLWGHGANLQGDPGSRSEAFKRWLGRHADWWLGYTELSRGLIERIGFPPERVTILNNAVDTLDMVSMRRHVTPGSVAAARARLGLKHHNVGVFVGSLYEIKRIDFLLEASLEIKRRVPDFELLVLGSGELASTVQSFCTMHSWAHYAGMVKGQEKVDALAACKIMLNPGLVGLGVLDSFVCGVPMLTTDCGLHSPEISYMESGVNGLMTANTPEAYVAAAVEVLTNDRVLEKLRRGCLESATTYTVQNMAKNFARGVKQCLEAPTWR